ncbi:MAG TPA: tetratricopeptide repeat protein [Pyrinomonadaceae bacterium]|nr:tetratricopeptide repeat protein [Pyrinomonadaceae bacterium]
MFDLRLSSRVTGRRIPVVTVLFLLLLAAAASAQTPDPAVRQRALDTYESQNLVAALPLLEKAALGYPNDPIVLSRLGFALYANSADEKDAVKRDQMRKRARDILLTSKSLGDNSNLTQMALDVLSNPDASQIPFSNVKAAEAAIREGEAAFVRGDMDKAIVAYKKAFELDPNLYDAALYAGDAEFKKAHLSQDANFRNEHFAAAGGWFAKAIAINPDRETAYRYWGDALDGQGKTIEARDKFIEAIVAEPYGRRSYVGLTQWGERHQVQLGHPRVDVPSSIVSNKPGEAKITIDDSALKNSEDGSVAWIMYGMIRAQWVNKKDGGRSDEFAKAYPNETTYRHTLAEEVAALRGVIASLQEQMKNKRVKQLSPSLDNLMKLNEAGLLEPYVLFVRPNEGIARDYLTYRKTNRDKLKRYWLEVVIQQ